jgi:hypothetical protein
MVKARGIGSIFQKMAADKRKKAMEAFAKENAEKLAGMVKGERQRKEAEASPKTKRAPVSERARRQMHASENKKELARSLWKMMKEKKGSHSAQKARNEIIEMVLNGEIRSYEELVFFMKEANVKAPEFKEMFGEQGKSLMWQFFNPTKRYDKRKAQLEYDRAIAKWGIQKQQKTA